MAARFQGELRQWHRVTLDFDGPFRTETASTFRDYRLDVTFTHNETGERFTVPGFFAADGNAAETGASSGAVWRVHFNPPKAGSYSYTASFRTGQDIAAGTDPGAGTATGFNGESGNFSIAATNKTGEDFRAKGMLEYAGEHYLRHAGSGEVFIKGGTDSPENFLAYADFDNTRATHHYNPHAGDWNSGDPTWQGGKGKEIIGAVNYLAENGVNSIYFLPMNVGGDGKDVWPWTDPNTRTSYDVSKLAQWEIVFDHMDRHGVALHVVTQETENDQLLNGGALGVERAIYYRELIARFGHHNGVIWNLGEENTNTHAQRAAFADYFKKIDPYDHPVVVHTYPGQHDEVYGPLLGNTDFDGPSLQINSPRAEVAKWLEASAKAGHPWVVNWDEVGPASTGVKPDGASDAEANHDAIRAKLWGVLTAGGAGAEWYFGYGYPHDDLDLEDFRSRDSVWKWTDAATDFFSALPVTEMKMADNLTPQSGDFVFAKEGEVYAIYKPTGGTASLNLSGQSGTFDVSWYDPRTGVFRDGSVTTVSGGTTVDLGSAPYANADDWAVLVTADGSAQGGGGSGTPGGGSGETIAHALNAGGAAAHGYDADHGFSGGRTYKTSAAIAGTGDDALYQSERYGNFSYALPVADGSYDVTLQFAEVYWNAAGKRVFDVAAEGTVVLDNLDIWAKAGGQNSAYDVTVPVTVTDGTLNLQFTTVKDNAKVSAIRIAPAGEEASTLAPVELTASGSVLDGTSGEQSWTDDVVLSAFDESGRAASLVYTADGFGIAGGRFDSQIDHNPETGRSERLVVDFDAAVTDVILRLGRMNAEEGSGYRETGTWTAYDTAGRPIGSGVLGPHTGNQIASMVYDIPIDSDQPVSTLVLEATGYNHGSGPSAGDDSSDFSVLGLTCTPVDEHLLV